MTKKKSRNAYSHCWNTAEGHWWKKWDRVTVVITHKSIPILKKWLSCICSLNRRRKIRLSYEITYRLFCNLATTCIKVNAMQKKIQTVLQVFISRFHLLFCDMTFSIMLRYNLMAGTQQQGHLFLNWHFSQFYAQKNEFWTKFPPMRQC